jgi:heme exporter protein C
MLWPLLVAALGYTLVFASIVLARTRAAVMERRIRALLMARADEAVA